ncbi:MAG: DUF998 domain-containing protein [Promethearchaeota archaeon]|nr:MAG: DUF998 domain-containing protein [Candidatus Lokiarchaeota archaeon]
MNKSRQVFDTLFKYIPGGLFGLASVILAFIFVTVSYLNFPGYNMMDNDVSILGIGPELSAIAFNVGLIVIGFVAIPFFIYLGRVVKKEADNPKLINRSVGLTILGCISLSLLGIFPVMNETMGIIHAGLALTFFLSSLINLVIFGKTILNDNRFPKIQSYISIFVACLIGLYIATRFSIVEWLVFFALGFWMIDISVFTLVKKL